MKKIFFIGAILFFLTPAYNVYGCQVFEFQGRLINGCEGITYGPDSFLERIQNDYHTLEREYGAAAVWVGIILIVGIFVLLIKFATQVIFNFYMGRFKR